MNDQNKPKTTKFEESPKTVAGNSAVHPTGWRKLLSRRWVFPAAYMAAAAIIVAILWLNSGTGSKKDAQSVPGLTGVENEASAGQTEASPDASQAAAEGEALHWPVKDRNALSVILPFYDEKASDTERQAAMVQYKDTFTPHMAVDLASKDNKTFDVLAAAGGKVLVADQHPTNGYEVQIQHPDGLVTVYESLSELKVAVGDTVEQGDVIGKAGTSELEKDEGVHVHFEVLKNGTPVNPNTLIENTEEN